MREFDLHSYTKLCRDLQIPVLAAETSDGVHWNAAKHLKDFAVIRADATDYNDETRSLMKRFSVVGPPTIIFLSPHQGKEVPDTMFVGPVDAKTFMSRLKQLRPI